MTHFLPDFLHSLTPTGDHSRLVCASRSQAGQWLNGQSDPHTTGPWMIVNGYHIRNGQIIPPYNEEDHNEFGDCLYAFKDETAAMGTALDGETMLVCPFAFSTKYLDDAWLKTCFDTLRPLKSPIKTIAGTICERGTGHWTTNVGNVGQACGTVPAFADHDATLEAWAQNVLTILSQKLRKHDIDNASISILGRDIDSHGNRTPFTVSVNFPKKGLLAWSENLQDWMGKALTHLSDQYDNPMAGVLIGKVWGSAQITPKTQTSAHHSLHALATLLNDIPSSYHQHGKDLLT